MRKPPATQSKRVDGVSEGDSRESEIRRVLRELARNKLAVLGILVIGLVLAVALLAPIIAPYEPYEQSPRNRLRPPSATHWLGTDEYGRDVFSRVVWGSRISLVVGVIPVAFALGVGVPLGLVAGMVGGRLDNVFMRLMDAVLSFPTIVLAIAIVAMLGPGLNNAMLAIGLVNIPYFARLVRGQALALKNREFVQASYAVGASGIRVALRHVLPNMTSPIIVQSSLTVAAAIVAESSLSFLGLGAQPPAPAWGSMLRMGYEFLLRNPSTALSPGMAIFITVLGFNLLGDALRDVLDPNLRGKGPQRRDR